jgi:RNA polymerase sigma-70 factor (sigma-E family)
VQAVIEVREGVLSGRESGSDAGVTLAEFAAEHSIGLTRFAYLLCGDRQLAEDLVQEAYLALYRRFGERLVITAPVAYARRTIANAHISRARKRSAAEAVTDAVPERVVNGIDITEQDAMWRALAVLPRRQRAVLVLRYHLDLPDAEIADLLGCRAGTVRSLAARAFAALRENQALTNEDAR